MIADAVRAWFSQGTGTDFAHLAEEYPAEELVRELMRQFPDMNGQASVAARLRGLKLFPHKSGSVRTVAFFYYRAYNGGSEMVMSRLSGFFARAGYRIVLLTDLPPDEADYPFPEGTERYILPDTFRLTFLEALNANVLQTVYGAANVTSGTGTISITANTKDPGEYVYAIDMVLAGGALKRIVIPCGALSELGDIVYKDDEPIGYEVTLDAMPDSSGNNHYEYIKLPT